MKAFTKTAPKKEIVYQVSLRFTRADGKPIPKNSPPDQFIKKLTEAMKEHGFKVNLEKSAKQ
jgi:hypothetical protein